MANPNMAGTFRCIADLVGKTILDSKGQQRQTATCNSCHSSRTSGLTFASYPAGSGHVHESCDRVQAQELARRG